MRIRKYANISAFLYTNSNLSTASNECMLQNNFCQLNQSPWDIITFPSSNSSSSFYRFDDNEVCYNVNVDANGSSIDSFGDFESMAYKNSGLGESDNGNGNDNGRDNDCDEILGFKEEGETSDQIQQETKLCGERDEKGWQCGSVVKYGNTMCDYHISELQNQAIWTTKKKSGPGSGFTTGARPRRPKKRANVDPHEFYYYSGFGPSWGKKRGSTCTPNLNVDNKATSVGSNSYTSSVNGDMDVHEMTEKRFEPSTSKVDGTIVYMDEDEEEDKKKVIGKKKWRKPIKERSLKSLM